jgi:RNA polymerase sigma-70 factor (ECF subfamily)
LVLVDMEGYSVEEAAQILGCAPGTIKSRCARGPWLLPLLAHLKEKADS